MESHQQQLASLSLDDGERDWASLPLDLLKICLGAQQLKGDRASKNAALASCKAFGRAVLRSSQHTFGLQAESAHHAPAAQIWRELLAEEQLQDNFRVILQLHSAIQCSPGRCLHELLSAGERLAFVTELYLQVRPVHLVVNRARSISGTDHAPVAFALLSGVQGLSLDAVLPPGVSTLVPNLQQLMLRRCTLTPAARTSVLDAGCGRLRHVQIEALSVKEPPTAAGAPAQQPPSLQQLATAQLRQLAKLLSLTSVELQDASCPTLFLVALGTQLTRLELDHSHRQCEPGTQTPTPAWRATLQHVARCTRLLELDIPCGTAEELDLVALALQQLRALRLIVGPTREADGDAMMEALLALPHLTSLEWSSPQWHTFQRWRNDSPCRWETLTLGGVAVPQLARLPLHSLKQPVQWRNLLVLSGTPIQEVRAAVANVTRRCPAGFRWEAPARELPVLFLHDVEGSKVDVPAVLRALQPLLASMTSVGLGGARWDVGWVKVLGEVLPCTCTRLMLGKGGVPREALEQVARSLPWVRCLGLREQKVLPDDVVAYVRLARRLKEEGREVRLEEVVVLRPVRPQGVSEAQHKQAWEEAVRAVRVEARGVTLRVVW